VSELLSQQEIDSLLSGIATGQMPAAETEPAAESPEREAIVFDFRLPHRLSKNQVRTFQAVHENFAEAFGSYLIGRLQATVAVSVTSVDQLFYSEFLLSISRPSCLYIFKIVESDAMAILELSPQLVLAMVEHLLGGNAEGEKKSRAITRIEQSIVKGIVLRALADLQRAWRTITDQTFKLDRYESEGDFAQIAPASEIVMVISFEVTIGSTKHLMNLCFPTFAMDDVLARLNVQNIGKMDNGKGPNEWSQHLLRKMERTRLPVVGILGTTTMTIRNLLDMEPGDILVTNTPTDGEVEVLIGGKKRLVGHPGISGGTVGIQVTRFTNE
jgi:flagellar motor switch protein FliM